MVLHLTLFLSIFYSILLTDTNICYVYFINCNIYLINWAFIIFSTILNRNVHRAKSGRNFAIGAGYLFFFLRKVQFGLPRPYTSKVGAVFQAVLLLAFKAEGAVKLSGSSVSTARFWHPVSAVGSWGRRRLVGSSTVAVVGAVALSLLLWWLQLLCGQGVRILIRGGSLA